MAFEQAKHLVTNRLEIPYGGRIEFDVEGSPDINLSPIPVAFTPTGGGTGVAVSGDVFFGRYTLIGNLCYFAYQVVFTNITNFGTGQYYMDLPFPTLSPLLVRGGCLHDVSASTEYHITGHAIAGSQQMNLLFSDKVGAAIQDAAFKQGSPITLTTADTFHIQGIYEADLS
jgi:hypothetical protein